MTLCYNLCVFFCMFGANVKPQNIPVVIPDDLFVPSKFTALKSDCVKKCNAVCQQVLPMTKHRPSPVPNFVDTKVRLLDDYDVLMPQDLNAMVEVLRKVPDSLYTFAHFLVYAKRHAKGGESQ